MRTFVYVDSAILNSYVSQMYNGLVTRKQEEALRSTQEADEKSSSSPDTNNETHLKLPPVLEIHTGITHTGIQNTNTLAETDMAKELIENVFHDNAIQELIDKLEELEALKHDPSTFEMGDYVLFTEKYDVFDIDFLSEIFSGKAFNDIMKLSKSGSAGMNREERRANKNTQPKDAEKEAQTIFNAICKIVPCKKMIVTTQHFIPLDENFLRESLQGVRFKYGREITILGRITNTPEIVAEERRIIDTRISGVVSVANLSLFSMLSASAKWILTPIALFFE